jgi:hypothetical protein
MTSLRQTCRLGCAFALSLLAVTPRSALAWGDEGHEIVALIADAFLYPGKRGTVGAMLADDPTMS